MKTTARFFLFFILLAFAPPVAASEPPAWTGPRDEALRLEKEGSYAQAASIWRQLLDASDPEPPPATRRNWKYHFANCAWRAQAAGGNADPTAMEPALELLRELAEPVDGKLDETAALANESLGDFHFRGDQVYAFPAALPYYQKALQYWAEADASEEARQAYLRIVLRPILTVDTWSGYPPQLWPPAIAENAVTLARSKAEVSQANLLLALALTRQPPGPPTPALWRRIAEAFATAIIAGPGTAWRDDALHYAAQWAQGQGKLTEPSPGNYAVQPDFVEAARLYRQLLKEFPEGASRWHDQAARQVQEITGRQVRIMVTQAFLPDSLIPVNFVARNTPEATINLRKLDLAAALAIERSNSQDWSPPLTGDAPPAGLGETVRTWKETFPDQGPHVPVSKTVTLDPLPVGAYWVGTHAGEKSSGALVLVTDLVVSVFPAQDGEFLAYACSGDRGLPVAEAQITGFSYRAKNKQPYPISTITAQTATDADGVGRVRLAPPKDTNSRGLAVLARSGDRWALITQFYEIYRGSENTTPKTYVFTDQPAYRPTDQVRFKAVFRRNDAGVLVNAPGTNLHLTVIDPRGEKRHEVTAKTDAFGCVSGEFTLPADAPLGSYRMEVRYDTPQETKRWAGAAELFRLEEYKLPEFRVAVKMPEKDGEPQTFRLGEKITADVEVTYYSGGAIPEAKVAYDIFRRRFQPPPPWPEPYPWLTAAGGRGGRSSTFYHEPEQLVRQGEVVTDARGRASIDIETSAGGESQEYRIVAKVTDASRRTIEGTGAVRVTAQPFTIFLRPEARIYLPGDTVNVEAKAVDPNGNPVAAQGTAILTREVYLRRFRKSKRTGQETLIFEGYEPKEIERRAMAFSADGSATLRFKLPTEGYYRVRVVSPPAEGGAASSGPGRPANPPDRVVGDTTCFAATKETRDLGYRFGALQIFADKESYRVGDTAKFILISPSDGGAALLVASGDGIIGHRLVRFDGTAKLVEMPVTEAWQPNAFLDALMIRDGQALIANEDVLVPPVEHYLQVALTPGQAETKPGAQGTWTLRVTDSDGKPAQASVALSVYDAALEYIQADVAPDIREFFYGEVRSRRGSFTSMLQYLRLSKVVKEDEDVFEERVEYDWRPPAYPRTSQLASAVSGLRLAGGEGYVLDSRREAEMVSDELRSRGIASPTMAAPMSLSEKSAGQAMFMFRELGAKAKREDKNELADEISERDASMLHEEAAAVEVRTDFRSSAFWDPAVKTDAAGEAKVSFKYPQSLTEWKAVARAATAGTQFGQGSGAVQAALPLMVRLQTPRFLVEGDKITLSAIVSNETSKPAKVNVAISAENLDPLDAGTRAVEAKPGLQARAERTFAAKKAEGRVKAAAVAKSSVGNDAMERSFPLVEHGMEKLEARSAVLDVTGGAQASLALRLPAERNPAATTLRVLLAPSLASTCLDALPYLAHYPYGCVEQTLSRFVPAAVAAQTLRELKLSPEAVANRLFGGIEAGSPEALKMKKGDLSKLDDMIRTGLKRLRDMQNDDGGWGWFKTDNSDPFMTAYVVQGLSLARQAGVRTDASMINRSAEFLLARLVDYEDRPDMAAWLLYALSLTERPWETFAERAADRVWQLKDNLNPYTRALLALTFHHQAKGRLQKEYGERAAVLVRNLSNGAVIESPAPGVTDPQLQTCHWGEAGITYRWSEGGVEATAFALRAILEIDPQNVMADQAARWLVLNRRAAQWKSTRDTAIVIQSLLRYMKVRQEGAPDLKAAVLVNGREIKTATFTAENALGVLSLDLPASDLRDGGNAIELRATGKGRLYASAWLTYFTKENPIPAGGNEVFVTREYFRLRAVPRLLGGVNVTKLPLRDGEAVASGEEIEVRLQIEAKNHLEYLMVEDRRPAACENTQVRSGEPCYARARLANGKFEGEATPAHQELRDQLTAFFFSRLPQGTHELTYRMRAEFPGYFHALPAVGQAMYVPEIKGNSDEIRVVVQP